MRLVLVGSRTIRLLSTLKQTYVSMDILIIADNGNANRNVYKEHIKLNRNAFIAFHDSYDSF